jgi:uncharacterized membrane protein (Fun14 family)
MHSFISNGAFSQHKYKIPLAIIAIALISVIAMGSMGIVTVNTATAQNTRAGSTDISNMTTFEENMTGAGVKPSTGGMTNWTK